MRLFWMIALEMVVVVRWVVAVEMAMCVKIETKNVVLKLVPKDFRSEATCPRCNDVASQ